MFCYTDFTIPPDLRQNFTSPRAWQALRLSLWKLLRDNYGAEFAVEATHPIGDEHPDVFHPHLNFLWSIKPGFTSFIDLIKIKEQFRTILKYDGIVNMYHSYGDEDAQLYHLCKYITRIFPAFADWSGSIRWYGSIPKRQKVCSKVCPTCRKKISVLGYIDSDSIKLFDLYGFRLGLAPPWEDDAKITYFKKHSRAEE